MGSTGPAVDDYVDVLIVGAGPAGLMMAEWMSRCGVRTRIVDKRGTKVFSGQADGVQARTLEIFDSFDFAHRCWRESCHLIEFCLWNPDAKTGELTRKERVPDTDVGCSRFHGVVLHQGRIERFFLDSIKENSIKNSCNGEGKAGEIRVERGVMPAEFHFDESIADDDDAYPITVKLRHLTEDEATPKQSATSANGQSVVDGLFRSNLSEDDTGDLLKKSEELAEKAGREEIVKAKYMVGADGAHSWVRNQLGYKLEGDSTDYIWGVLDIIPKSNFPDIRSCCAIHSESSGSIMVIPRENKLVRLYTQLTTTNESGGKRVDRSKINPQTIIASAQKILHPYTLDYSYLDWWTAYQIGQRVGSDFSLHERVFLAGDAVHTHSPKAGQGMNVSMGDTYNLGWKIANVVKGIANRSILKTYQSERRRIAQDLIEFDHKLSRLFSGRPAKDVLDEGGVSMDAFREAMGRGSLFAAGMATDYGVSMVVAKDGDSMEQGDGTDVLGSKDLRVYSKQELATNIPVGMRMPSFKVLNQSDARPYELHDLLKSNGRWRVIVFAGNIKTESQNKKMQVLGEKLASQDSFLRKFTPSSQKYDSVIELLSVHSAPRLETTIFDFPEVFRPWDDTDGWDYWKIHVDAPSWHEGDSEAYKNYGVDPEKGCAVILRPDQYISWVGEVDDYESMNNFFEGFMLEPQNSWATVKLPTGESLKDKFSRMKVNGVQATDEAITGLGAR